MIAPGADPYGTGPLWTSTPAVTAGAGSLFGNPPAGAGGTALTATFG
ncbi:hypothetical protein ACSDR0_14265 [Streptosporangium sp. G11]